MTDYVKDFIYWRGVSSNISRRIQHFDQYYNCYLQNCVYIMHEEHIVVPLVKLRVYDSTTQHIRILRSDVSSENLSV
jgi:hypothetical protein